jgi:hypothetical protein
MNEVVDVAGMRIIIVAFYPSVVDDVDMVTPPKTPMMMATTTTTDDDVSVSLAVLMLITAPMIIIKAMPIRKTTASSYYQYFGMICSRFDYKDSEGLNWCQ